MQRHCHLNDLPGCMKLWGSSERLESQFSVTHQKWKADKSLFMIQPGTTRKSCDFRIRVEQWEHPMTRCQFRFAGRATLDCALQRFYQSEEHSAQSRSACAGMQQDSYVFLPRHPGEGHAGN